MRRPAAIFDLDGTLLPHTSAERLFVEAALRERALEPWRAARGAFLAAAGRLGGRTRSLSESKDHLRGARCEPLEQLGVECVHSAVWPRLRPSLLAAAGRFRAQGFAIVLLSGTLDFLGMELARLFGAEFAITSRLGRRAGRFTGAVLPPHPHGGGKLVALQELATTTGIDLEASHAYANRHSDRLHMQVVGTAHAVAPDRRLRRLARARGWEVHDD